MIEPLADANATERPCPELPPSRRRPAKGGVGIFVISRVDKLVDVPLVELFVGRERRRLRLMSRLRVVGGLATAGVVALTACAGGSNAVDPNTPANFRYVGVTPSGHVIPAAKRKKAGAATASYLNGKPFALRTMRGKVIVLNYWAHWCTPCVSETPGLEQTYTATKADGVEVIGIAVKDEKSAVASFVRDHHLTYPIVFDEISKTALQLGNVPTFALPSTVVIDREGRVAAVYLGAVLPGDLEPVVKVLAGEK